MSEDDKHRISRVVTRSGDQGETGLADGSRLSKDSPRIEAMGVVDELNASVGYLRSQLIDEHRHQDLLAWVQQRLFDIGGELAIPDSVYLKAEHLTELEAQCDVLNQELPPLREFVLPGGTPAGAWCHVCRTQTRTAERRLVPVDDLHADSAALPFLNRLSDLFFMLSRAINREAGEGEAMWTRDESRKTKDESK
mgnify:CR=1 FL=1